MRAIDEADLRPARLDDVPGTAGGSVESEAGARADKAAPGAGHRDPGRQRDRGRRRDDGRRGPARRVGGDRDVVQARLTGRGGTVGRAVRVGCLVGTGGVHVVSRFRAPRTGAVSRAMSAGSSGRDTSRSAFRTWRRWRRGCAKSVHRADDGARRPSSEGPVSRRLSQRVDAGTRRPPHYAECSPSSAALAPRCCGPPPRSRRRARRGSSVRPPRSPG